MTSLPCSQAPRASRRTGSDRQDLVAHVAELEGRFHAGDAAADDESVVAGHDFAPVLASAASVSENWFMCLAKFSAQTEQIAAILSRWACRPLALRSA